MELMPYLESLRRDLAAAAAPGGPEVVRAAELLVGSLDASARLCLLEVLSDAAAEITTKLDDISGLAQVTVDVQLRGRDAQLVVAENATRPQSPPAAEPDDSGDLVRITLRLPEGLKDAVERQASAAGISTNAWLVRAVNRAVAGDVNDPPHRGKLGKRVTGFAQA